MKRILSIIAVLILAAALPAAIIRPVSAAEALKTGKKEVVYGILDHDGSVREVYVVNIFESGNVTDYGDYTRVKNLTTTDPISQKGDTVIIRSNAERLYYQGTLKAGELPWLIDISYTLNGKPVQAAQLPGAEGALEIRIAIRQNPQADEAFFKGYALQVGLTLSSRYCRNITAEGATIAQAGADSQISYILLPGRTADITVSADVAHFQMDSMTFSGVRLILDVDADTEEITGRLEELSDAIARLDDGAGALSGGAQKIKDAMEAYLLGIEAYQSGMAALSDGAEDLATGAAELSGGLEALAKQGDSLVLGAESMRQAAFDQANLSLAGMGLPTLTAENYSQVLSGSPELQELKARLDAAVAFAQGLASYTDGVSALSQGAAQLCQGAVGLDAAASQAASGARSLYDAALQLSDALSELKAGMADYKSGTAKLRRGTDDLSGEAEEMIDELLSGIESETPVKSFVSEKNRDVTSVQFVIRTEAIEGPDDDIDGESIQESVPTFWQRLAALFKAQ